MNFDTQRLLALLPSIDRARDEASGRPLTELLSVIAGQVAVLEENLAQLYDDQFIETCAEWVVPYLGDLLGVRGLHEVSPRTYSTRAYVANTMAYRRRKGTAAMVEQLARDVTGWNAVVVEFFERLATTQSLNHIRLDNQAVTGLRRAEALEDLDTAFDRQAHSADVRRATNGRGRFNIPSVGIFLWRLNAHSLTLAPAIPLQTIAGEDIRRRLIRPLGNNLPLFARPEPEEAITDLAGPLNVPLPLSRRSLASMLDAHYGAGRSLFLVVDGKPVLPDPTRPTQQITDLIDICDLSDLTDSDGNFTGWAHTPPVKIAVDPVLGRIAFPDTQEPQDVRVTSHYGFSAELGGGEYARAATFEAQLPGERLLHVPSDVATITSALVELGSDGGIVEIQDSGRYAESIPGITLGAGKRLVLRAANLHRPTLVLPAQPIDVTGGANSVLSLNGLVIAGGSLRLGALDTLRIQHCTLVPGWSLASDGTPQHRDQPSLEAAVEAPSGLTVEIDHCITGALHLPADGVTVIIRDSIVDALGSDRRAIAGMDGDHEGPSVTLARTTIVGSVWVKAFVEATDTLFTGPVAAIRRQIGCIRYCFVPNGSSTPSRYRCQPDAELTAQMAAAEASAKATQTILTPVQRATIRSQVVDSLAPRFTSTSFGHPAYAQLAATCPLQVSEGAEDGAEMGAFHDLYQPQRVTNLRASLDEYLRFGLEAGIFFAS